MLRANNDELELLVRFIHRVAVDINRDRLGGLARRKGQDGVRNRLVVAARDRGGSVDCPVFNLHRIALEVRKRDHEIYGRLALASLLLWTSSSTSVVGFF